MRLKKQPRLADIYRDVRQDRQQSDGDERLAAEIETRFLQRQQRNRQRRRAAAAA
jgi:hypothetical protein